MARMEYLFRPQYDTASLWQHSEANKFSRIMLGSLHTE